MADPRKVLADTCEAGHASAEPDLMGWDQPSRARLATLGKQGVVAVRYEEKGCDVKLEILPDCIGEGRYQYAPYAATDTKTIRTKGELYASLPVGAGSLEGRFAQNEALRTDFMLVGVAALPAGSTFARELLHGTGCEKATHVVSRVYLGGFAMVAGSERALAAKASLFGVGAGGDHDQALARIFTEGSPEQCKDALQSGEPKQLCSVPLRVGLLALPFGEGDGGYAPVKIDAPAAPTEDETCAAFRQGLAAAKTHFASVRRGRATVVADGAKIYGSTFRMPGGIECSIREEPSGATTMFCNADPAPSCEPLAATGPKVSADLAQCLGPAYKQSIAPATMMFPYLVSMIGPDGHKLTMSLLRKPDGCLPRLLFE